MRLLPVEDPGTPDGRSPARFLLWTARHQWRSLAAAAVFGMVWMAAQALTPAAVGRAVDAAAGTGSGGRQTLPVWCGVLLGLALTQTAAGVCRHRMAVFNRMAGAYRTVQVVGRHAAAVGAGLPRQIASGEVVSVGTTDINAIGGLMDITGRAVGSLAALAVVVTLLLAESPSLGLLAVAGAPAVVVGIALLLRPLHRRQEAQRELQGALAARASDIVAGLRVLRGVGGERIFSQRYRAESQQAMRAGVRVASVESWMAAAQVLLPGVLVAVVTWIGAREAVAGRITVGQLVAFYAYTAFLVSPLAQLTETADRATRAHVAACRVVRILALRPAIDGAGTGATVPAGPLDLVDEASGLRVRHGLLTAVAAAVPEQAAAIADRLGRWQEGAVTVGGRPLAELPPAWVRREVLVTRNEDLFFSGPLRAELDVRGGTSDGVLAEALSAASAGDIVDALPDGLDSEVAERGLEFSGGQLQRLRLARALAADPLVLVLVEPTSAVDAHTEAGIAERLAKARRERTTVVVTTSPLLLDRADRVAYVRDGRVVAEGTHRQLLESSAQYAATVARDEQDGDRRSQEREEAR